MTHYGLISKTIDLIEGPAAFVGRDGTITAANGPLASALRVPRDLLVGLAVLRFLPDHLSRGIWRFLQCTDGDVPPQKMMLGTAGRSLPVVCKPLKDGNGIDGYLLQRSSDPALKSPVLQFLRDDLAMGIWDYDVATGEIQVSQSWRDLRGIGPDGCLEDQNWLDDVHPADRTHLETMMDRQNRGEIEMINVQYRVRHTAGHWVWILCRGRIIAYDPHHLPRRIVGCDIDISEMKQTHDEVEQLASKLQMAMETSQLGVWEYDSVTNQTLWDDRVKAIYGIEPGGGMLVPLGFWQSRLHPDDADAALEQIKGATEAGRDFQHEYRIVRTDGAIRHIRSQSRQIKQAGEGFKLIGVNLDITEHYEREQALEQARAQLEYEARHDALTGLANRWLLDETFAELHRASAGSPGHAIMTLDVDRLKPVNDTFGHSAGDTVLRVFAERLRALVPEDAMVARTGGDEFVVLLTTAPPLETLEAIAAAIVTDVRRPIRHEAHVCTIGVSIGIALGVERYSAPNQTFINADLALYEAKKAGRSCYRVFTPKLRAASDLRLA